MRKTFSALSILLAIVLPIIPSSAQTSAEISSLIKKSKLVDSNRDVNAVITPGLTTISTYAHPRASDQDVKITALLMMKELRQHYKTINHVRAVFFDPGNVRHYREVEIVENDVRQVDLGKPVPQILSHIAVRNCVMPVAKAGGKSLTSSTSSSSAYRSGLIPANGAAGEYATYRSADGDVSMQYPKGWMFDGSEQGLILMRAYTAKKDASGSVLISLYRYSFPISPSLEDLVNSHENEMQAKLKNSKQNVHRQQNISGFPAFYNEISGIDKNGPEACERSCWIRKNKTIYALIIYSYGMPDHETNRLFQTISSSLRIQPN